MLTYRMIIFFLVTFYFQFHYSQTTYYSMNGSSDPNNLNNWTQDPTGNTLIFPPTSFNNEGDVFIIDGETMSLTAIWIVAGEIRVYGSLQNPDWYRYQAKTLSIYLGISYMHSTSSTTSKVENLFIGPSGHLYLGNPYGGHCLRVDSSCIVDGTLYISNPMVGTGNFYLNNGGTLQTINGEISISGNTGNIRVSGTRQYSKQANYKYISSVGTYTTGNGLPDSVASLTLDHAENSNTTLTLSVTVIGSFISGGAWGGSNDNSYILLNSNSITCLGSISISGDVSITGNDQSAFILKGDDPATYSIRALTIGNFTMDRDAEIIMRRNVTVSNNLTLLRGLIKTGNYVLQLGISSEGNIQQVDGRIVGNYATVKDNLNTNSLLFPVGTEEFNRFVNINYITPPTAGGLIKVSHKDSLGTSFIQALNDSGFIINYVLNLYWEVTPVLISGGIFNLTVDVSGQTAVSDPSVLRLVLSNTSGTQYFLNGIHSNGVGTIIKRDSLSGSNTFGRYYVGSDSDYVTYSNEIEVEDDFTPKEIVLYQNYPNPFNPRTVISYQLPVTSNVTLKIYDILGNEVATLVNEEKQPGVYEVEFSVGQDSSPDIASGIYFYKLKAEGFVQTKKMILAK